MGRGRESREERHMEWGKEGEEREVGGRRENEGE